MTDHQLSMLDAATTPADLDVRTDPAAQTILDRVRAGDRVVPIARPRRTRRLVLASGAAAAAGALVVTAPSFLGGPEPAAAWTPVPTALTGAERADAAEACTDNGFWSFLPGRQGPALRPYVMEERGGWTLVYSATPDGMGEQVCLLRNGEYVGAHGQAPGPDAQPVAVGATGAHGSIGGVFSDASGSQRSSTGIVGSDVVGLVLHTETQGEVTATVNDGHYAAWWPDEPVTEESENADTTPSFSHVTLTLADGSTRDLRVDEFTGIPMDSLTTPDQAGTAR